MRLDGLSQSRMRSAGMWDDAHDSRRGSSTRLSCECAVFTMSSAADCAA
jgi:hypothetical protein